MRFRRTPVKGQLGGPRSGLSHLLANLRLVLIGLDLDGVVCDLGPGVAARISDRFGLTTHPSTWRSYDLRSLRLGLPHDRFCAFLDETFADPSLYCAAPVTRGAVEGVSQLRQAGWAVVGITARPPHLAAATTRWLGERGLVLDAVHHTAVGSKAAVATDLGVDVAVEDNPVEAELLAEVCRSFLLDHPYNRDVQLRKACRLHSWDDLVGRLCQLRLFA
jgi:uncharacterized HAD superfamily protein